MTTITPILNCTAHANGVALWWAGEIVEVFPNWWDASAARNAAAQANRMLDALISPAPTTRDALEDVAREMRRRMDGGA